MQSRRMSLFESITNVVVGYVLAIATQLVVLSYARKLVMAWSGGGLKLLDAVLELNPSDDLWHAVCAVKFSPFRLR